MNDVPQTHPLSGPAVVEDPYSAYHEVFEHEPVYLAPDNRTWFVGHHAEVSALLRDPTLSSNRTAFLAARLVPEQQQAVEPLISSLRRWLMFQDPPAHTPIRRAINGALSRRLVTRMREHINALVDHLVARFLPSGRCDLIADLAYPLPAIVIAEMLGARAEDRDRFKQWSDDIAAFLGSSTDFAKVARAQQSVMAMAHYFREQVLRQRTQRQDNLLAALVKVQDDVPDFGDEDLVANCIALVFAGHETTTNLIGNAVHLLLDRPDLWNQLAQQPSRLPTAIEEFARFESPVQRVSRVTTKELEVAGRRIPPRSRVVLCLGATGRDPRVFKDPQTLLVDRAPNPHLGFGFGIHLCSGVALARLEAAAALEAVLTRMSRVRRVAPAPWQPNFGLRGLTSLPLQFDR